MTRDNINAILATLIAAGVCWVAFSLTGLQTQAVRIEERIVAVQTGMSGHERRLERLEADVAQLKIHEAQH